jgi:hypothetical protein
MRRKKLSVLVLEAALALLLLKSAVWSQALINPDGLQVYVAQNGPVAWGDDMKGWAVQLWNGDGRGESANIFQVSGIPIPPSHVYVNPNDAPGWRFIGAKDEGNGKTTVSWVAIPGHEAQPGTWTVFWIWGNGASKTADGSYCALGSQSGNCSPVQVMSW